MATVGERANRAAVPKEDDAEVKVAETDTVAEDDNKEAVAVYEGLVNVAAADTVTEWASREAVAVYVGFVKVPEADSVALAVVNALVAV